jgi:hypothetical protein
MGGKPIRRGSRLGKFRGPLLIPVFPVIHYNQHHLIQDNLIR